MELNLTAEIELHFCDERVVMPSELDVRGDAFTSGGVGELLGDALTIFLVGEPSLGSGKIVLVVGVFGVSEKFTSLPHPKESTT